MLVAKTSGIPSVRAGAFLQRGPAQALLLGIKVRALDVAAVHPLPSTRTHDQDIELMEHMLDIDVSR